MSHLVFHALLGGIFLAQLATLVVIDVTTLRTALAVGVRCVPFVQEEDILVCGVRQIRINVNGVWKVNTIFQLPHARTVQQGNTVHKLDLLIALTVQQDNIPQCTVLLIVFHVQLVHTALMYDGPRRVCSALQVSIAL
jgi:hypothetical protein